ncbi:flagellar hook-associated protein FlgK [Sinomonas humi]|uniref:Flagellar hook-associated protein 1 n=1 Tax=Sinomonas humi TaxID=1338436 RepID=A0A0B2AKJ2_9MICC|nr:flagellar hook-associated protein FlgK [Sinomonas humi]KHL02398.1 flagellar hook protein FlgK [Sinomonas humi]
MSTFGALNVAYRGLSAAQQAIDLAGQNIDNVGTDGYTRQRIEQSAVGPLAQAMGSAAVQQVGQGVSVDGIARLGDALLDTSVRSTSSSAGYAAQRSTAYQDIEATLQEPGTSGISAQLQSYWSSWQDLANQPGDASAASTVIQNGKQLAAKLSSGYSALSAQWASTQSETQGMVTSLNDAATQVAALNTTIRSTLAAGGNANELIDQRSKLTETIASLAGGTVRQQPDGTVTVFLGGNALVTGGTSRAVQLVGAQSMADTSSPAPSLVWADRPSVPVGPDGGTIAGDLSILAPANGSGTGGPIAEAAAQYNSFATSLAQAVNTVHAQGKTPSGTTGLDFFSLDPSRPAAQGLGVVPTDASGIATGAVNSGAKDGSNADAIAQLSTQTDSPDSQWASFVSILGSASQAAQQQATTTQGAATNAKTAQTSNASVSLDEENVNLLAGQHAYEAAARVLTALDQTLDTLINHMGTVGL